MLERYAVKVARTVLRRGGGSNPPSLFDYVFPSGRSLVRDDNDAEGKGYGRKQMAARNKLHRGIALVRKDADFPLVSHCMNRDKLRNMRKSITPNGEMLIDIKCYWAVSWNYKGRIENCRPILKGYGMLEPYAVKVASTVLRRGRAGNRSFLFDRSSVVKYLQSFG